MPRPLHTRFVIADGARARLVERDHETGDFHTLRELHAHNKAVHGYSGGVVERATGHHHGAREPHEPARRRAQAFAAEIAAAVEKGGERLVIVAPARVLGAIEAALPPQARKQLAGTLAKDLTKVADHDLSRWLTPLEM
ncbi:MAG TPA: host attachment protein [Caulobacteraceae bacterium]